MSSSGRDLFAPPPSDRTLIELGVMPDGFDLTRPTSAWVCDLGLWGNCLGLVCCEAEAVPTHLDSPAADRLWSRMGEHVDISIKNDRRGLLSARRAVELFLRETESAVCSSAVLIISELVTNALLHGEPPVSAALDRRPTDVRISVSDTGRDSPFVRSRADEHGGYGLRIVASLGERWGCDFSREGKTVWCEVALPR